MLELVRWMVGIGIAVWLLAGWCGGGDPAPSGLRPGSFNIRMFPEATTDADAVAARIAELDADAFAVEEIRDPRAFEQVLKVASARTGRDYAFTFSRYCVRRYEMYLGVVYDRHRVHLREARPLASERRCAMDHPSAHAAVLEAGSETLALVAVHLKSGGNVVGWHRRRTQWRHLAATYRALERELDVPVIFAGDFNTTGLRDDSGGERSDIGFASCLAVPAHGDHLPSADWITPRCGPAPIG